MRNMLSINLLGPSLGQLAAFPLVPAAPGNVPVSDSYAAADIWGAMKEKLSGVKERAIRGIFSDLETINRFSVMTGPLSALIAGATVYLSSKMGVSVSTVGMALGALKRSSSGLKELEPKYRDIIVARTTSPMEEALLVDELGVQRATIRKIRRGSPVSPYLIQKITVILDGKPLPKGQGSHRKVTIPKLSSTFELYQREGSLRRAGEDMDLSRERVRQLLKSGAGLGLFSYSGQGAHPNIKKESMLKTYRKYLTKLRTAKKLKISTSWLDKLLERHGITAADLRQICVEEKKKRTLKKYNKFKEKAGHELASIELESPPARRRLSNEILLLWGSIGNFRKENNIADPGRQKRREKKEQALNAIRDIMGDGNWHKASEMSLKCDFEPWTVLRLLCTLTGNNEAERRGNTFTAEYRLKPVELAGK